MKLDDNALDDPRVIELGADLILEALRAVCFSNRHGLDGRISPAVLRRISTQPDPETAAAALVAAGVWEPAGDGWQARWVQEHQDKASVVQEKRDEAQARMARLRTHNKGKHHLCDPEKCWALRSREQRGERSRERSATHSSPLHSDRSEEKGERTGAGGAAAPAGGEDPAAAAPPAMNGRWSPRELDSEAWPEDHGQCARCGGFFDDRILDSGDTDEPMCPRCASLRDRGGDDCLALTKGGPARPGQPAQPSRPCRNRRLPGQLWCRNHVHDDQRGQAANTEQQLIDRAADEAVAEFSSQVGPGGDGDGAFSRDAALSVGTPNEAYVADPSPYPPPRPRSRPAAEVAS